MGEIVKTARQEMTIDEQLRYAQTICNGSLVPKAYQKSPANVLIAMGFGQAMGLSPAESLYRITVINGKPSASAELIAANVRKAGHRMRISKDAKSQTATVEIVRADDPDFTFTSFWDMSRAEQAGLAGKDNWKKYPLAMLTARAITECARDACPEALYGVVYTGEEMGANFTDEHGQILEYEPQVSDDVMDVQPYEPQEAPQTAPEAPNVPLAEAQNRVGALMREAKNCGYQMTDFHAYAREQYNTEIKDLSEAQLIEFAAYIEQLIQAYYAQED